MRTDIKIKDVNINFNYYKVLKDGRYKLNARKGDIIGVRDEFGCVSISRVIGKVFDDTCPKNDKDNATGLIACIALSENSTYIMEQWINPDDVIFCYDPNNEIFGASSIVQLHHNFFSPEFRKMHQLKLRQWPYSGFSHWDNCNK